MLDVDDTVGVAVGSEGNVKANGGTLASGALALARHGQSTKAPSGPTAGAA